MPADTDTDTYSGGTMIGLMLWTHFICHGFYPHGYAGCWAEVPGYGEVYHAPSLPPFRVPSTCDDWRKVVVQVAVDKVKAEDEALDYANDLVVHLSHVPAAELQDRIEAADRTFNDAVHALIRCENP